MQRFMKVCKGIRKYAKVYEGMQRYMKVCKGIRKYAKVYTKLYKKDLCQRYTKLVIGPMRTPHIIIKQISDTLRRSIIDEEEEKI